MPSLSAAHPVRVLHLPGDHAYVRAVTPETVTPALPVAGGFPHPAWAPGWLTQHAAAIDVVHVHFGHDHLSAEQLARWVGEVRRLRLPLVVTVHDLRNPHHEHPRLHDEHLDLLVPAADALLTLTDEAARRIAARWGRRPMVSAHPPVLMSGPPARDRTGRPVVGVHLKDLRRNVVEPGRLVTALAAGARAAGGRLRVDLHPGAAGRPELAPVLADRDVDVRVHPRFTDEQLTSYLAGLDVSVLPYRFGTHSGWLEACRDVGTRVVAPSTGLYRHQWQEVVVYPCDEVDGPDDGALARAVGEAVRLGPTTAPGGTQREDRLRAARALHADVYDTLLTGAEEAA